MGQGTYTVLQAKVGFEYRHILLNLHLFQHASPTHEYLLKKRRFSPYDRMFDLV